MTVLNKLWHRWLRVGRAIGDVIARVVLTVLYFTLVLPFGLISALLRDPLDLKPRAPVWLDRRRTRDTLDEASKQS